MYSSSSFLFDAFRVFLEVLGAKEGVDGDTKSRSNVQTETINLLATATRSAATHRISEKVKESLPVATGAAQQLRDIVGSKVIVEVFQLIKARILESKLGQFRLGNESSFAAAATITSALSIHNLVFETLDHGFDFSNAAIDATGAASAFDTSSTACFQTSQFSNGIGELLLELWERLKTTDNSFSLATSRPRIWAEEAAVAKKTVRSTGENFMVLTFWFCF